MLYESYCSGIEAATVAWHPLGWTPQSFSEIEKFPSAVLSHHWPHVPNVGDMTKFHDFPTLPLPDLIAAGTPCQAFSVAGLRKGLADPRGNLTLVLLGILERKRPRWLVWENVPGVLSDKTGAFGAFLGGLGQRGYGFAYRVLDAQYFGVPQRRRRVFVVGYLGDWRRAAAVLFEPESMRGDSPPLRQAGKGVAALTANGVGTCGADDNQAQAGHIVPIRHQLGAGVMETVGTLCADSHPGSYTGQDAYTGRLIPTTSYEVATIGARNNIDRGNHTVQAITAKWAKGSGGPSGDECQNLVCDTVSITHSVRRLTPTECERLQGFPDGHTLIPWKKDGTCPDGPRYRALGNSMAVPVMRWIGERIAAIDALTSSNS